MKPGLAVGDEAVLHVQVTEEMFAQFDGHIIHPVYSTFWMVHHMEHAARKLILPYLEDWEEGIGSGVQVVHKSPSTLGQLLTITATVTKVKGVHVEAAVEVRNAVTIAGSGVVHQVILPKEQIATKIAESQGGEIV